MRFNTLSFMFFSGKTMFKKEIKLDLSVVFYHKNGKWFSHCLELDIVGDANSKKKAFEIMFHSIALQVEAYSETGNIDDIWQDADPQYFEMFERANAERSSLAKQKPGEYVKSFDMREFIAA